VADDGALLSLDLPDRAHASAAARKALTALNGSLRVINEARLRDAHLLVSELVAMPCATAGTRARPFTQVAAVASTDPHVWDALEDEPCPPSWSSVGGEVAPLAELPERASSYARAACDQRRMSLHQRGPPLSRG
jgi:hypothetical protein